MAGEYSCHLLLLLCFVVSVQLVPGEKRVWIVGYEKVNGTCMPVGGLTKPGKLPFPYSTFGACEEGKTEAVNFDERAKRWDGFALENGKCLKVWGRAEKNPFPMTSEQECEQERDGMKAALSSVKGSSKTRQVSQADGLRAGKFMVESTIRTIGLVFPPANLMLSLLNFLWPSGASAWEQVRTQVTNLINQKMNLAYANDLRLFIAGLKREMETYNGYQDTSSLKLPKLISIDTVLGVNELKFMDVNDPISCLTYFVTFATTRLTVKRELMRLAPPSDKQQYAREFLKLHLRFIPYTGEMAHKTLKEWRLSKIHCTWDMIADWEHDEYVFRWRDEVTGTTRETYRGYYSVGDAGRESKAWCKQYDTPKHEETDSFIAKLRENIAAWGSQFNIFATNPLVKGFTAADSNFTTDEGICEFPFTHNGVVYNKCTTVGHSQLWCNKKGGGRGNCMAVGKLNIDLTSCKMPTSSTQQYFGHKSVAGGKTCRRWDVQGRYLDFPMDNQDRTIASNYCRRTGKDARPWCYTVPSGWKYCNIRDCTSADWF